MPSLNVNSKPDNVGFKSAADETTEFIQLFDFGLCRELPSSDSAPDAVFHMSAVGTRRYMAPEIVQRTGYNLKVDVYGWAMVFFEMLALQRPYDLCNRDVHRILVCQGGQRPCIRPFWPNDLKDLLRQAWAPNHADRPTMDEIIKQLVRLLDAAKRQQLTPTDRSLQVVCELAGLFSSASSNVSTSADLIGVTTEETMSSFISA